MYMNSLDYSQTDPVPKHIQQKWFRAQLDLARKLMKPICLHIRGGADDDALRILEEASVSEVIIQFHALLLC